ncbi:SWI SNF-related matrix-associated actin-dependent regulator of chromatin subfamily A 1 isoform X1 [Olea europaea subsp. europaea]|uniref:SWI SNF-related matrix-associated actin-dependent regulator of chromatin subfamily A 1 isoform X1 n=3 Tax=Olea europaea subsp. europaea TaxID=158383 RepID=A0A8S0UDT7_OLEEU|nr:SWI SNF-related matrix-associated actin-dependent regulator of chromatin subfamily A 1 isoform X1 [Olea europaea subsp. europaea]
MDDWELSAEELDFLERDALRQLAERNSSSAAATTSYSNINSNSSNSHVPSSRLGIVPSSRSPAKPAFLSCPPATNHTVPNSLQSISQINASPPACRMLPSSVAPKLTGSISQINASPPARRMLPSSVAPKLTEDPSKKLQPKITVKLFLHASGNIAAKFPYDQVVVECFHRITKASWYAKERLWMFPLSSLSTAEKVLSGVPGSNVEVENLDPLVRRAIAASSVLPDLRDRYDLIPTFIESKLLSFQREGVRFILQHGVRVLLADEMGLGKTLQAIAVTSCIRDAWPVLVLTPSSLRLQWASMIHQWLDIPSSDILVVLSQWSGSNRGGFNIMTSNTKRSIHLDGVFNIISYDIVQKLQDVLMASEFKVVIADESHFLKNAQAKRTNASLPILQKAQFVMLLSGTPALSRPIELFKQLEALYPDVYKNVHEYGNRYCKGGVFGIYQGASNHEELHNLMKATVMIRRLKKDVLSELPVKRRQQVFLDLGEKEMRQINALFRELQVIKGKIKSSQSKGEAESLKFTEKNLINKIYTDSAEAKIPAVMDYLGTVIEAGCKFLIFAHHQPMIDSIHQFLLKKKVGCIRIDGSTPAASRQALVTDFQEKDSIKAAVLSIKAGGVGLTLTAASTVIFAELSWTPGDMIQAEDRAHRIGQVSSVNIYYLLANDTVDDIIWDVIQSKLENLGQMLDGHENSLQVSIDPTQSSPAKQRKIQSSPAKQTTLDSFLKPCRNSCSDDEPKSKYQRH